MQSIVMRASQARVARRQANFRLPAAPAARSGVNPESSLLPEPSPAPLWTWFMENPRGTGKR